MLRPSRSTHPPGLFTMLLVDEAEVAAATRRIIEHSRLAAAMLTAANGPDVVSGSPGYGTSGQLQALSPAGH